MDEDLIGFLKEIQLDFCWLLYSKEYVIQTIDEEVYSEEIYRAGFPYCCDLASVLLASFLSVQVSNTAKAYITQTAPNNHAWCECEDEIIDYTYFQFMIEPEMKEKFKKYQLKREEFDNYISQQKFLWTNDNTHIQCHRQFFSVIELELISASIAKKYRYCKEDFLRYVEEAFEMVELKLNL